MFGVAKPDQLCGADGRARPECRRCEPFPWRHLSGGCMTPSEAITQMIDADSRLPMACARAIKKYEGWRMSDAESLKRLRQCLRLSANRGVKVDWLPIIVRLCVHFDAPELVTGLIDEARRDAEYELRREQRESPMRSVKPRNKWEERDVG